MKKKLFSLVLCIIMCVAFIPASVFAADEDQNTELEATQGDFEYTETADSITITKYKGSAAVVTVPEEINDKPVTAIGDNAFYPAHGIITEVKLPSKLSSLGNGAFNDCYKLQKVNIPAAVSRIGNDTFNECYVLTSVELPDGIESIGCNAFSNCTNLVSIKLPDSVESIDDGAFAECSKLENINMPASLTRIGERAFSVCYNLRNITLPDGVKEIGPYAFSGCRTNLTDMNLPDSVESLGEGAFSECWSLTNVKLSSAIKEIEAKTFNDCYSLKTVELPEGIESIGDEAFKSCRTITSVFMPQTVTSIGDRAFEGCARVTEVYFPAKVETVGDNAFNNFYALETVYICDTKHFFEDIEFGEGNSRPTDHAGVKIYAPSDLDTAKFENLDFTYDGAEHAVTPVCKKLASEDYVYDELTVKDSGTYELVLKSANPKACYGEKTLKITVAKKHLEESDVTISGMKDRTYTGKALKQSLTIKNGDQTLTEGTDYKVYYDKNTSVGIALVDIVFRGNYSGTIENLNFTINPAAASVSKLTPGTKKLTVKMSTKPSSKGASTYQIGYKKKGDLTWKYTTTTSQSKTIKSLKKGKRYYVKVRAYKTENSKKYYGAWSSTKLSSAIK